MSACLRSASSALEVLRPMQGHSAPPATSTTHQLAAQPRKVRLSFRKRSTDVEKAGQHDWRFATTEYQNDAIFVNTEGFRPCLSKPSYRAPKWALMVRLMQKERLKSPQKSLIIENQAFWVILAILAKTAILVILASHFRARVDTPTKSPTWGLA